MKERNKIHYSIMVLCFIFAGFCIIQLFYTSFILRRGLEVPPDRINDSFINQMNSSDRNPRDFEMRRVSLPFAIEIFPLFGFIVSLFAGMSLLDLLKKRERKKGHTVEGIHLGKTALNWACGREFTGPLSRFFFRPEGSSQGFH